MTLIELMTLIEPPDPLETQGQADEAADMLLALSRLAAELVERIAKLDNALSVYQDKVEGAARGMH